MSGPVTGFRPRIRDRLRFAASASAFTGRLAWGAVVGVALLVYLAWWLTDGAPLLVGLGAAAGALFLAWALRLYAEATQDLWRTHRYDFPRRRRSIPGPPPGDWAIDVVPVRERYAVLLLHYTERGDLWPPDPVVAPRAQDTPPGRWAEPQMITARRLRTLVAFDWADDVAAAESVAEKLAARPAEIAAGRYRLTT